MNAIQIRESELATIIRLILEKASTPTERACSICRNPYLRGACEHSQGASGATKYRVSKREIGYVAS